MLNRLHLHHIAESNPLRIVRHPHDSEFRFQLDALVAPNALHIAFDRDSGGHDSSVVAQVLMQPVEDHRKRDILRGKRARREKQEQNTVCAMAHDEDYDL